MTPSPPPMRCFLLIGFLLIPMCDLYGGLFGVAAVESEYNGARYEEDVVYLASANSESEEGPSGEQRSFQEGLQYTTSGKLASLDIDIDRDTGPDATSGKLDGSDIDIDRDTGLGVSVWPWDKTTNATSAPIAAPVETSCSSRTSCLPCNSLSCHWCTDGTCHAKGSPYGCAFGTNCATNGTAPDGPSDPADRSCGAHPSCTDCVLSSHLCHWCASDDSCHAIGSWYGCAHGTDCYNNDRCRRSRPEPIKSSLLADIGYVPILLVASIGLCSFFCSSVLYGGVKALHGAYRDLATARAPPRHDRLPGVPIARDYDALALAPLEEDDDAERARTDAHEHATKVRVVAEAVNDITDVAADTESPVRHRHTPLVTAHPDPSRIPTGRTGLQNMNCLVKSCQIWYIFTIVGTILVVTLSFYCFPRMPQYNLCADEFAWKSIIAGLTSLKLEASFELLLSIQNKNHLNITLEQFSGKLNHDGGEVGSFQLPQSTIVASSITDVLVTCTVVPSKWEALGLISEYYKGSLVLSMSVNGAVKVTGIYYSFPVKVTDIIVRVNDPVIADRHLCSCPEWKDLRPSLTPLPEFFTDYDQKSAMTIF